ncbi:MAG: hypothetical protein IPH76_13100 [Xanthomonadales bacterium]|nr:hypothetical protein [Xanthomonadales bacterium]
MKVKDFKRVVGCFSESPANFENSNGQFILQMMDEVIDAHFEMREGALYVTEGSDTLLAQNWIIRRLARVQTLADRILMSIPEVQSFVTPGASYLPSLESAQGSTSIEEADALAACTRLLSSQSPGTTQVVYLTSDAGEGKTTLIGRMARQIAENTSERSRLVASANSWAEGHFSDLMKSSRRIDDHLPIPVMVLRWFHRARPDGRCGSGV